MDKLLLDALNNLSVSLENLTSVLQQKSESKSDVASALSSGDLSKKLDEILSILKSTPKPSSVTPSSGILPPKPVGPIINPSGPPRVASDIKPAVPTSTKSVEPNSVAPSSGILPPKPVGPIINPSVMNSVGPPRVASDIKPAIPTSTKSSAIPVIIDSFSDSSISKIREIISKKSVDKEVNPSETMSRPSAETVSKEKDDKSFFDPETKKRIKDGVQLLLFMSVGIVAIGLAFKLIGGVDFKSVLALSIALPLIAIAFEKISQIKVTPKDIGLISLSLIAMSVAILVSSFFLSKVSPVGLAQAFSTVVIVGTFSLIAAKLPAIFDGVDKVGIKSAIVGSLLLPIVLVALSFAVMVSSNFIRNVKPIGIQQAFSTIVIVGAFAVISLSLGKLLRSFDGIGIVDALIASAVMPIVLIGVSYAVMRSSDFIRNVKPIGIQQAFSTIVIAGTFAIISLSLGKLLRSFDGISPVEALIAAVVMPIVLIGVSYAIMKSSEFIGKVKPIGLQQAFSSIVIAATFTVLAFGIGKLLKAFDGVNPIEAVAFSLLAPILLVAVSYAIMVSSKFISQVKPVGFLNFVSSVMISLVFVVLSFGLKKMVKAFDGISVADAIKASIFIPIVFVALSWTIMKSSPFISNTKPVGFQNFIASIMISVIFVAMSFAAKFIVQNTKNITAKDMLRAGGVLLAMAAATYLVSLFIGKIPRISTTQFEVFVKLTLSLVAMAGAALAITKISQRIDKREFFKGAVVIVGVAATIMLSSILLSAGDYSNLPSSDWVIGATLTIGIFAGVIFGAAKLNSIIGPEEMIKGAFVVLVIAAAVMATSLILGLGNYDKYPTAAWVGGVGLSLLIFGIATATLGAAITLTAGLGAVALAAGIGAVIAIAASITEVSKILSQGEYGLFPTNEWISGVAKTLLLFGTAVVTLGAIASGGAVLEGITFGLVKNPLDAGIDSVKKISELIVETSSILAGGDYGNYPTDKWISGVAKTLLLFGSAIVTLGAISSGGGALEGISFGLVKNPITAGVDAIKAVSQSIVDADSILSTGSYTGGPKVEWSRGIGMALGEFSKVYKMLQGSQILSLFTGGLVGGGLETFVGTISGISLAIKEAGDVLASGNFTGGPKEEWAKSIAIALGAFAPVYSMIEKAQVMKLFSFGKLGVSVDSFVAAIKSISLGIKTAGNYLSVGNFTGGPSENWAKGVGLAIGAFSEVYSILQEENLPKIFGGGVSVQAFKDAIVTISEGLKESAMQLGDPSINWTGGPSETWARGVGNAIQAFAPVFKAVSETKGIFIDGPSIEEFKSAIITISKGIIESADVFGNATAKFDLAKAPKAEWGQNVGAAIQAFSPVFTYLSENSGWFSSGASAADDLQNAIRVVSSAIQDSSVTLSTGFYGYDVSQKWTSSITKLLDGFVELFSNSDLDMDSEDILTRSTSIQLIASSIKGVSTTLSLGKYNVNFGKFGDSIKNLYEDYLEIYDKFSNIEFDDVVNSNITKIANKIKHLSNIFFVSRLNTKIDNSFFKSLKFIYDSYLSVYKTVSGVKIDTDILRNVELVASSVSQVSRYLSSGSYNKFPSVSWSKSAYLSLQGLLSLKSPYKSIDSKKLAGVLDLIKMVDMAFSKGKFNSFPSTDWSEGVIASLGKFSTILQLVDFSKFENKFGKNIGLSRMIGDISQLARVFDKLSESLQKVSSSIGLLDSGKIESIRSLTSNVVLLSLMDATQFDAMMTKLEENSHIFGHLLSEKKSGGVGSSGSKGAVSVGGKSESMSSVKLPVVKQKDTSSDKLDQQKMMNKIVELLADIASVTGSKGSLSEYIGNKDDKKNSFNWFSND